MIVLVGAGSIGKRHLTNLLHCGVTDFIVVDPREDRRVQAEELARRELQSLLDSGRNLKPLQFIPAGSSDEAFALGLSCDGVVIATPPLFHPDDVERALLSGCNIFCEKPLATDAWPWEELKRLIARAQSASLVGMVGYNYRFCPQLLKIREMLAQQAVGRILSVRGTFSENLREWHPWEGLHFYMSSRKQGGGALLDESHVVDLCRWLFGEIDEVMGYNESLSSLTEEPGFDADDLVEILVRFQSGAIGSLHMDLYGKYHQKRLEIIGEEATLFWNFDNTDVESNGIELWKGRRVRMGPDFTRRLPEQVIASDWVIRNEMYREEIRYFLNSVKSGAHLRSDVADLQDGLKTLAVLRAARRAAFSKQLEKVEEIDASPREAAAEYRRSP